MGGFYCLPLVMLESIMPAEKEEDALDLIDPTRIHRLWWLSLVGGCAQTLCKGWMGLHAKLFWALHLLF